MGYDISVWNWRAIPGRRSRISPVAKLISIAFVAVAGFGLAFWIGAATGPVVAPMGLWLAHRWPWILGAAAAVAVAALVARMASEAAARRMMPLIINVLLVVLVVLMTFVAAAALIWWGLGQPALPRVSQLDLRSGVDLIKLGLTVAGGLGAVIALVVAYRRQRVTEQENARAEQENSRVQLRDERESAKFASERFATACTLLGHEAAAVRLAGVYAVGALSDDWPEQRQACIDVLCAYLRMPYQPQPEQSGFRVGEREVRLSITRVIRDHLRIDAPTAWYGHTFDFTGAVFDCGDFSQILVRDLMDFRRARFVAGAVDFRDATFGGGAVDLREAEFLGGALDLRRAGFRDLSIRDKIVLDLRRARLHAGGIDLRRAAFRGGIVDLRELAFLGGRIDLTSPRESTRRPRLDAAQDGTAPAGLLLPDPSWASS